jgi:hypothetical protein
MEEERRLQHAQLLTLVEVEQLRVEAKYVQMFMLEDNSFLD